MNFKKFSYIFLIITIGFVLFNALIWNISTKNILTNNDGVISGDMARMGYLSDMVHARKNDINLPKQHITTKLYNFEKLDMLTLGDSFSQGNVGGQNRYYQDFIATYMNWNILNVGKYFKANEIETIIALAHSGFFKTSAVKYVLYQSTQRKVVDRLTANINFDFPGTFQEVIEHYQFNKTTQNQKIQSLPKTSFINNGNFKFLLYNFLYNFSDHGFVSKVYIAKTKKDLFSIRPYNKFLFYKQDLKAIKKSTQKNIEKANYTLNKLAALLKKQNIKLIFMPAVSKYDLYSKYMLDNPYRKDPFFDIFRNMDKNYIFIDTKKILTKELDNGEKDIYYLDDTHWSYKASDVIAQHIQKELSKQWEL